MQTTLLVLTVVQIIASQITAIVDPSTNWGTWEGWGCSLAWYGKAFGNRDDLADLIFTTQNVYVDATIAPGLGFNIARYNAGACSWNSVNGTTIQDASIPDYRRMDGYWLDPESSDPRSKSWDWTVDANQRDLMIKAKDRGANLFELFSNSPMWWMCSNHNPAGAEFGDDDNLPPSNYEAHVIYMSNIAKYASDHWNITFDSVELFNEPSSNWWYSTNNQEGCHFFPSTQSKLVPSLRKRLDDLGLKSMMISASDENTVDLAISTWNSFSQDVKDVIGRVNTHGYGYGGGRRDILYNITRGHKLWMSEYGEGDRTGWELASNLNLDFRFLHNTAWVYWQPLDGGGWGLVSDTLTPPTLEGFNTKYYVLAQYSRHIRPGMTIIDGGADNVIAAWDSFNLKLVLVVVNWEPATVEMSIDLGKFSKVVGPASHWETEFFERKKYYRGADVPIFNKKLNFQLEPASVNTFEVQNVVK